MKLTKGRAKGAPGMGEGSGLVDVRRLIQQNAELPASLRQEEIPLQHPSFCPSFHRLHQ